MFKSKGSLYILFPVVILIWGAIIYKIISAFGDDATVLPDLPVSAPIVVVTGTVKDTFSLLPVEKDPFLGYNYKQPVVRKSREENKIKVTWPEIQYLGIISGQGKTSVYILQFDGQQLLLEKGRPTGGLAIVNGSPAKIQLKFQGDSRVFVKVK